MRVNTLIKPALVALLMLSTAFAMGACADESAGKDREIKLSIQDGQLDLDPAVVEVSQGDSVTLRLTSDEQGTFHLHGYGLKAGVGPGEAGTVEFAANAIGDFPMTLHAGVEPEGPEAEREGIDVEESGALFRSISLGSERSFSFEVSQELEGMTIPYYNHLKRSRRGSIEVRADGELSGTVEIEIVGLGAFDPDVVSVKPGSTLVWTNYTEDRQMVSSGLVPVVADKEEELTLGSLKVQP